MRGDAVFVSMTDKPLSRIDARRPQTAAKRDREQAVKERRDRKRAKKADVTAQRAAANGTPRPRFFG